MGQAVRAVLQLLPARADARLIARNLFVLADSTDPLDIAERLGITVAWGDPIETLHAPAAMSRSAIIVSTSVRPADLDLVIARALAHMIVDIYNVATDDRFAFARELAERLYAFAGCGSAAVSV